MTHVHRVFATPLALRRDEILKRAREARRVAAELCGSYRGLHDTLADVDPWVNSETHLRRRAPDDGRRTDL